MISSTNNSTLFIEVVSSSLLHPIVTYCHLCIAAGTQAHYGGSLQSEEVSVEGSSESVLTGLVPNDTLVSC